MAWIVAVTKISLMLALAARTSARLPLPDDEFDNDTFLVTRPGADCEDRGAPPPPPPLLPNHENGMVLVCLLV